VTLKNLMIGATSVRSLNGLVNLVNYATRGTRDTIGQFVSHPKLWYMEPEELKDWHFKAIKQSFKYHHKKCEFYRDYCKDNGNVSPADIKTYEDILNIPQMPAEAFKKGCVSSIPENKIRTIVTTSGTSGNPSYLVRDFTSLIRMGIPLVRWMIKHWPFLLSERMVELGVYKDLEEAYKIGYKDMMKHFYAGIFMPDPKESSSWLVNGFKTIIPAAKLVQAPVDFYLKGFEFDPKKILDTIKENSKKDWCVALLGFHYVFNELMKYMDENGERLELDPDGSNRCMLYMAGGWKKLSGESIDEKEFKKKLVEHFGVYEPYIINTYGFGESNCLAMDLCSKKNMHLSPTTLAVTRDPETLEIQDYGKVGLMSIWDPTMHSFPSFVITDDIVKLTEPFKCECGLTTQVMEFKGRAVGAELRSCGLMLQNSLTEKAKNGLKELKEKQKLRIDIGV